MKKYLSLLVLLLCCLQAAGQGSFRLRGVGDSVFVQKRFPQPIPYISLIEREKKLQEALLQFYDEGYLAAFYEPADSGDVIRVHTGTPLRWARLEKGNADEAWLSRIGFAERDFRGKAFREKEASRLMEKLLAYGENNGYPFAELRLDSVRFTGGDSIHARLHLEKNQYVTWDSLSITGDSGLNRDFLESYLGVRRSRHYDEREVRRFSVRLRELLYIRILSAPKIVFTGDKARLHLHLGLQKSNRLNGVLGLAPNSAKANKLLLTGEVELEFPNLFGRGIGLGAGYKNFLAGSSLVRVEGEYPYIAGTPFGGSGRFALTRFDTSYYIVEGEASAQHYLPGGGALRVFYNSQSTRLVQPDAWKGKNTALPALDVDTRLYGLGIRRERLDFRFNPRRGYTLRLDGGVGQKLIRINPALDSSVYDTLRLRKTIIRLQGDGAMYFPIQRRSAFVLGAVWGLITDDEVFENQLFRIGGLRTLRGFDEESIFVQNFILPRAEYRFLTDPNSFFQLFVNAAYYENRFKSRRLHDTPVGFGAGYNYLTKVGLFSLSFAVGREKQNPFDFNAAKVHLGYLNRF